MPLFAVTIFASAFLLFLVQPIVAKQVLPWFGGSAAVWATCLVFFQTALLLGYAYADIVIRKLTPRAQWRLHVALLRGEPRFAPHRAGRVLEADRRRAADLSHPRHARVHHRPSVLPAVDDEPAAPGMVRATLPRTQSLSAVRAVQSCVAARAARVSVPAGAVGRHAHAGARHGRRATRSSRRSRRRPRGRAAGVSAHRSRKRRQSPSWRRRRRPRDRSSGARWRRPDR